MTVLPDHGIGAERASMPAVVKGRHETVGVEKASSKAGATTDGIVRKGARITGQARDKLAVDVAKKYQKGQSIRALAEGTGRSYGFIHRLLVDAEIPLRGRGGATRGRAKATAGTAAGSAQPRPKLRAVQ